MAVAEVARRPGRYPRKSGDFRDSPRQRAPGVWEGPAWRAADGVTERVAALWCFARPGLCYLDAFAPLPDALILHSSPAAGAFAEQKTLDATHKNELRPGFYVIWEICVLRHTCPRGALGQRRHGRSQGFLDPLHQHELQFPPHLLGQFA